MSYLKFRDLVKVKGKPVRKKEAEIVKIRINGDTQYIKTRGNKYRRVHK